MKYIRWLQEIHASEVELVGGKISIASAAHCIQNGNRIMIDGDHGCVYSEVGSTL